MFAFSLCILVFCCLVTVCAATAPKFQDIMRSADFNDDDINQVVQQGKLLKKVISSSNEREVAMSFAALFKTRPPDLKDILLTLKMKKKVDPAVTEFGLLSQEGSLSDFSKLILEPNGDTIANDIVNAVPGNDLNLSIEEMNTFHALKDSGSLLKRVVEDKLREMLFTRYKSYRLKGLAGILPYARLKDKQYNPGDDLLQTSKVAKILKRESPIFYRTLVNYPNNRPEGLEESFSWVNFVMDDGIPNISLIHRMALLENEVFVYSERHFYTLRGYNSVQAIGGAFPCEKGTAVIMSTRTSTDQVTGFGGSARRAIGARMLGNMAAQILERFREEENKLDEL